jgi:hypothetical protein
VNSHAGACRWRRCRRTSAHWGKRQDLTSCTRPNRQISFRGVRSVVWRGLSGVRADAADRVSSGRASGASRERARGAAASEHSRIGG